MLNKMLNKKVNVKEILDLRKFCRLVTEEINIIFLETFNFLRHKQSKLEMKSAH